jgi:hypothetical protein
MKTEFSVGDTVWWARYARKEVKEICPVCYGKRQVRVILGDDSIVETECTYCARPFTAYGYILNSEFVSDIQEVVITDKIISENAGKREVEYRHYSYILTQGINIFKTKDEAEKRLVEIIEETQREQIEKLQSDKNGKFKSYSWHVGYYQRMKRDALKQIELCDKKITHFKKQARDLLKRELKQ